MPIDPHEMFFRFYHYTLTGQANGSGFSSQKKIRLVLKLCPAAITKIRRTKMIVDCRIYTLSPGTLTPSAKKMESIYLSKYTAHRDISIGKLWWYMKRHAAVIVQRGG